MRFSPLVIVIGLAACGSPAERAAVPAPTPTPETTTSTPAPRVEPEPATPTAPPRPPVEVTREAARHVRLGREAAHAGDLAGALAAFDRALALLPNQPRTLCESGFVAHRAGDETDAARRIDRALALFGPPEHVTEALQRPLAMCLYNGGLVAEAAGDRGTARERYERSLALRPDATVRAALARVSATAPEVEPVAELPVGDEEALLERLRRELRGLGDDEETPVDAATVTIRERLRRPADGAAIVLLDVDSADAHYPMRSLVVAERIEAGYRLGVLEIGSVDLMVSGTEGDVLLGSVSSEWAGDVLVVHVTRSTDLGSWDFGDEDGETCSEQRWRSVSESFDVFCAPDAPCGVVQVEASDSGETLHRECSPPDDEPSGEVRVEDVEVSEPSRATVAVRVEGRELVVTGEGSDDLVAPGRIPIADLETLPGLAPN